MFADFDVARDKKKSPLQCHLPLSSRCFHVENWELPQINTLLYCFLTVLHFPPMARLAMSVFLWRCSDLPMPNDRECCMTEIYFWCISSSERYFSLPNKICILASCSCIRCLNIKGVFFNQRPISPSFRLRNSQNTYCSTMVQWLAQWLATSPPQQEGPGLNSGSGWGFLCGFSPVTEWIASLFESITLLYWI